jgi:hypothetical protein
VADVPVGALVDTGKVMALSGPAFATGGIFAQIVPFQELPAVQEEVTVIPPPEGEAGTSDFALLLRKNVLELYGIATSVLVPPSTVPVVTGGSTTKFGDANPLLSVLLVTLDPSTASGLVTAQVRVTGQVLAFRAIIQDGAEEVRVPDMMRGAGDTATSILSILTAPLLSVTVKRNIYVPDVVKLENVGVRVVPPVIVATDGVVPT